MSDHNAVPVNDNHLLYTDTLNSFTCRESDYVFKHSLFFLMNNIS